MSLLACLCEGQGRAHYAHYSIVILPRSACGLTDILLSKYNFMLLNRKKLISNNAGNSAFIIAFELNKAPFFKFLFGSPKCLLT